MNSFRITKYDPRLRDAGGRFRGSDWTSFGDVGRVYGGKVLTVDEYTRVETAYLGVIRAFAECCGVSSLEVAGLEDYGQVARVRSGQVVDLGQAIGIARDVLREMYWCRLEGAAMRVHFGWDYYMYIESAEECDVAPCFAEVCDSGLFVEAIEASPYGT